MLAVVREIRRHFYLNSNDMTKAEQPKRKAGRPKGAHDKKPRPKRPPSNELATPRAPPTRAPGTPPTAEPPAAPETAEVKAVHLFKRKGLLESQNDMQKMTYKFALVITYFDRYP